MAVSKVSKLGQKYGAKAAAAVQAHAEDETTYGFVRLPGSIPIGIAQLQRAYFEQYEKGDNKGEYYFRGVGVVLEPTGPVLAQPINEGSQTMIVAGLTTSLMIPVCDAKRYGRDMSQEENIAEILLHMRRLGGPDFTQGATIDDLEELAERLVDMAPFFKFSTSWVYATKDDPTKKVKKGDRLDYINETWLGNQGLEDYEAPTEKTVSVKGGAASEPANPSKNGDAGNGKEPHAGRKGSGVKEVIENRVGHDRAAASANKNPVHSTRATKPAPEPTPEPEPQPQNEEPEEIDLDALAADAADTDSESSEESGEKLIALAVEAGLEEDWARNEAKSWEEVVTAIREAGDDQSGQGDEPQEYVPEVGHTIEYCPIDPKTKRPRKEAVSCKISKVNEDQQTVELKAGKAVYKDIPWSDLVIPSEA